jgi:phosphopentomutase
MKLGYRLSPVIMVLALIISTVTFSSCGDSNQPRNVILIGWDGAQRENLLQSLERKELPNLATLITEGSLVAVDIKEVTDTKAGWAQILTGYNAVTNRVYSNKEYEPIPIGYTVFERLEEFFGEDDFITVAVIGKKGNVSADEGKPFHNAIRVMDVFINGLELDETVGLKTLELLEKYQDKPFFFFVHFAEVDKMGHKYGENSYEYNNALKSADIWTGEIMKKLIELNLYDDTLIYVTADHGFDEGMKSHKDAPYVFLATNDSEVNRLGDRHDIAPTILGSFGLDKNRIYPFLDGSSLVISN